jgi:hypothetical protein
MKKNKPKDKRDYIIALLSVACSLLIYLLVEQKSAIKKQNNKLTGQNKELTNQNEGLQGKNATLTSQNTLKGIKLDGLQAQIDALTKSLADAKRANNLATKMDQQNLKDQMLKDADMKISALEKTLKSFSESAQKEMDAMEQKNADLAAKLSSLEATTKKKKFVYKPPSRTRLKYTRPYIPKKTTYRKPSSTKKIVKDTVSEKKKVEDLGDMYEE